jgi:hypothetical protein
MGGRSESVRLWTEGLEGEAGSDPQLHAEVGADEDVTGRAMGIVGVDIRPMAVHRRLVAGPEC